MCRKLALAVFLVSLGGCTGHYYKVPSPEFDSSKYEVLERGTETATGIMLFGFIPIRQNNKIKRATDALIKSKGGDTITDVSIRERWFWAYVLNGYKVDVEGTVLKRKPEAGGAAVSSK